MRFHHRAGTAPLLVLTAVLATLLTACTGTGSTGSATNTGSDSATVTSVDYTRDPNHPTTGTNQAECQDQAGNAWLVTITAAQAAHLNSGDPCPAGPHEPMPQQQFPGIWAALTTQLPYQGGDPDSPCGQWSADNRTDANQMQADWNKCMAQQGNGG